MSRPCIAKDCLLWICAYLINGHILHKKEESERYGCSLNSIQRYFDDLRAFLLLVMKKPVLSTMWPLSSAVRSQRFVNITYKNHKHNLIKRKSKPVGILFSEFYFYLIAFIDSGESAEFDKTVKDCALPAIYRIGWIQRFDATDDYFRVA